MNVFKNTLWLACVLFLVTLSSAKPADRDAAEEDDAIDMDAIMKECNETYNIDPELLKSLNESGSFPDESQRTPKCFIRCYLEKMNLMTKDGGFDKEVATYAFLEEADAKEQEDFGKILDGCILERDEKCKCEKAYNFLKCVLEEEMEMSSQ